MCRMLAVVSGSPFPVSRYLVEAPRGLLYLSLHGEKAPHRDGFGYAFLDGGGRLAVRRWGAEALARVPDGFPGNHDLETTLLIAHARKASPEYRDRLPAQDAHPFLEGGLAMAHNGGIRDAHVLDPDPGIDSQRLTRWLSRAWRPRTPQALVEALAELLTLVHDYTAINLLLSDGELLYAFRCCREKPDYYTLCYRLGPEIVVASEPLDAGPGWHQLKNGELLQVSRDLSWHIHPVPLPQSP